jgi:hypothetical protein
MAYLYNNIVLSERRRYTMRPLGGIKMKRHAETLVLSVSLMAMLALILSASAPEAWAGKTIPLEIKKIYFEYNSTDNDLGVHIFLDGEDWRWLKVVNPKGLTIFAVEGKGPYAKLGLTELFFEGAEPNLADVPLEELLGLFPEGKYKFSGMTVYGDVIESTATLTHAIPAGPSNVTTELEGDSLFISWDPVKGPPAGFPAEPIRIVGYQVIVGSFQVTVPASTTRVTVSPEFVASLDSGDHEFEVLAIEAGGNQTITVGCFTK